MYDANDLRALDGRLRRVYILSGIVTLVMLAVYILLLISRLFWPCYAVFTVLVIVWIFIVQELIAPVRAHKKLILKAIAGSGVRVNAVISRTDPVLKTRFGCDFCEIFCIECETGQERKFYIEKDKFGEPETDAAYELRTLDNFVLAIKRTDA